MRDDPLISVVICTRNRGSQLAGTLESLRRIEFEGRWEIVIVNNGSTDNTGSLLREFANDPPAPVRIVFEPVPGLSRARNRGLASARGELVAFTDDDCYPTENYLDAISTCFATHDIAFAGGRVLLFDPTDQRVTIRESNAVETIDAGDFVPSGLIHGANMIARRSVLLELNGFDERLGAGTAFKSGEDTDMLRRITLSGRHGRYDPSIAVYHHHGRKTPEAAEQLERGYRRGFGSCMIKYVMNPVTRSAYARIWYWRLRKSDASDIFRELRAALQFAWRYGPGWRGVWEHPHEGLKG